MVTVQIGREGVKTRRAGMRPHQAGLVVCALVLAAGIGLVEGWPWLAVPALLVLLGVSAWAVGADSRAPGDWRSASRR